jgi:hypothetical protein
MTNCVHSVVDYYGLLIIMDRMNNINIYTQFTQTISWDRSIKDFKKNQRNAHCKDKHLCFLHTLTTDRRVAFLKEVIIACNSSNSLKENICTFYRKWVVRTVHILLVTQILKFNDRYIVTHHPTVLPSDTMTTCDSKQIMGRWGCPILKI